MRRMRKTEPARLLLAPHRALTSEWAYPCGFKSGARNHLPANRPLEFRFGGAHVLDRGRCPRRLVQRLAQHSKGALLRRPFARPWL